jgi:signal transduction histidine kinase
MDDTPRGDFERQMSALRAEMEALREQLWRAHRLATVGTMTAMVAHEFNNILTPIINYAQLASQNPAMLSKAVARAADGGQRATRICKAILGMTRQNDVEPEAFRFVELIQQTLDAMARPLVRDRIELLVDVPADLSITARRIELQQVLLNLLINARTAVLSRGAMRQIEVGARHDEGKILIRVGDNGTGICRRHIGQIFQPFFTTKDPDDDDGGHGLGLTICLEIITAMDGTISADSEPGQGATFTIVLPQ